MGEQPVGVGGDIHEGRVMRWLIFAASACSMTGDARLRLYVDELFTSLVWVGGRKN